MWDRRALKWLRQALVLTGLACGVARADQDGATNVPATAGMPRPRPTSPPVIIVVTRGQLVGSDRGLPGWTREYGDRIARSLRRYAGSHTQVRVLLVNWNTDGMIDKPARAVAQHIRQFVQDRQCDAASWDLFFVGHSRGALFNHAVIDHLGLQEGPDRRVGTIFEVLLDPTASSVVQDNYPTRVHPGVARAKRYDDEEHLAGHVPYNTDWVPNELVGPFNEAVRSAEVVIDGRAISGAEEIKVLKELPKHRTSWEHHEDIRDYYRDHRLRQDVAEFDALRFDRDALFEPIPEPMTLTEEVRPPFQAPDNALGLILQGVHNVGRDTKKAAKWLDREGGVLARQAINGLDKDGGAAVRRAERWVTREVVNPVKESAKDVAAPVSQATDWVDREGGAALRRLKKWDPF